MKKSILAIILLVGLFVSSQAKAITLQEGLIFVSKQSRDVLKALKSEAKVQAKVSEVLANWFPQIELYANKTYLHYQPEAKFALFGSVPLSQKEFITYGFKISQLIYDFGSLYSNISATKAELKATRLLTISVRNSMALEFIKRYLDVLEAEKLLEVAKHQETAYEEHLRDAKSMYENGLVTKNDLLQAEVTLAEARQERINAENLLKIKKASLNIILKRSPDDQLTVEEVSTAIQTGISLSQAYQRAVQTRPELAAIKAQLEALKLQKTAIKRQFFPKLYLAGGYEYEENRYMVHEGNWSLILGLKLDLFSGGQKLAKMNEIDAAIDALKIEKEKLEENIKLQVKAAYLRLQSAKSRLLVAKKAVTQAEENYRLHTLRYKEGVGTSTDVTDALVLLRTQQNNYYKALYEAKRAEAELLYSMGADLVLSYTTSQGGKR